MTQVIKHQFFFAHPPEAVWQYLTDSGLMAQWLMKNTFKPVVGAIFQFTTGPIPKLNFDGIFHCKVLEIVPLKKLSYTWNCGPGGGEIDLESVVVWQLMPRDNGTELFLEHSGFAKKENLDMYHGLLHGWLEKFQNIEKLLAADKNGNTIA